MMDCERGKMGSMQCELQRSCTCISFRGEELHHRSGFREGSVVPECNGRRLGGESRVLFLTHRLNLAHLQTRSSPNMPSQRLSSLQEYEKLVQDYDHWLFDCDGESRWASSFRCR